MSTYVLVPYISGLVALLDSRIKLQAISISTLGSPKTARLRTIQLYPTKPFYRDEARVKNFIIYLKCMRHLVVKYKTCPGQSLYVRAVYILWARL